jgi:very-short-patch-repair endonuclease
MNTPRDQEIANLYRQGKNMREIGTLYGISHERVRQLLVKTLSENEFKKIATMHSGIKLRNTVKPWKFKLAKTMRWKPTPSEALLFQRINRKQLGVIVRRQAIIRGWIADFYIPSKKIIIELDGKFHKKYNDNKRDKVMDDLGFRILRFKSSQVFNNIEGIVEKIKENLS